jgi:CheY-like chemotaxis protein
VADEPDRACFSCSALGFDVREAGNGQEVIDTWQAWQPHLILMDLGMLAMDGREAAQRIKASSEGSAPIIIALAASSFKQPRRALLQTGCDDFLSKPFQDGDLYEMLRKHLGVQYVYADEPAGAPHLDAGSGEVASAETMAQVSDRNREGISGPRGTILIVDDNPAMLESLRTLLTEQGYTVHIFLDGKLGVCRI